MSSRRNLQWSDGLADMVIANLEPEEPEEFHWSMLAACQYTDPEAFFPEKGGSTREAKRVCRSCVVQAECLDYALDNDEKFGIWGGMSERERRASRRNRACGALGEAA